MRKNYDYMTHANWIDVEKIEMFSKTRVPIEQRKTLNRDPFKLHDAGIYF